MDTTKRESLYAAQKNIALRVVAAPDVAQLANLGLRPGTRLAVENRYRLGGPVLLKVEDSFNVAIGKDIAEHIEVVAL